MAAIHTLPGMLHARSIQGRDQSALWQLSPTGQWVATTWGEYADAVASIATGLQKLGMAHGDRIGIMAGNSKEWDYAQLGIQAAGGIVVGLDAHDLDENIQAIARRCNFAGIVIGDFSLLEKLGATVRSNLRFIVSIAPSTEAGIIPFSSLLRERAELAVLYQPRPEDASTIIFTSGTTGKPKGIQYNHRQLCLAVTAILDCFPDMREGHRAVCWLPLSNPFQRTTNHCAISRGIQTFYIANPKDVMQHVATIAPHFLIGVPRFYEKLYAGIQQAIMQKPLWQQRLMQWALRIGDRRARMQRSKQSRRIVRQWEFFLAEHLVLRKLRAIFGPNLQFMVSGSAPIPTWLLERFHGMGLLILEAYGISENSIPIAFNRSDDYRFGTVGQALSGNEIKLAEDGELLVRGAGVFHGYFEDSQTDAEIDQEGFRASGDFATIDDHGFITLIGRKSEIFKTSGGRRIAPAQIEACLRELPHVEHAVIFGAQRTRPVALVAVSETAWHSGGQQLRQSLHDAALRILATLPGYMRPAGMLITAQAFTVDGGELTANLKLRRRHIETKYATMLAELYQHVEQPADMPFAAVDEHGLSVFCRL